MSREAEVEMSRRGLFGVGLLIVVTASVLPTVIPVAAQAPKTPAAAQAAGTPAPFTPPRSTYKAPRTPWGDPDLQGVYDYLSQLPLQRPLELGDRKTLTDAELAEWRKLVYYAQNADACGTGSRKNETCTEEQKKKEAKEVGYYNEFWMNRDFVKDNRTSLIVDPPTGRFPPFTPAAEKILRADIGSTSERERTYASWEDFPTMTRCVAGNTPNGPALYNSGTYIMQTPGWVLIVRERLDTRMISLDGRPHPDKNFRQWQGHSRGHFEGNTLVVDTTNFTNKNTGGASGGIIPGGLPMGNIHLIEHFVPVSAKRIDYYATVIDPTTWTQPWTLMIPWENQGTSYQIYEYACNEDNTSVGNALRGERMLGR